MNNKKILGRKRLLKAVSISAIAAVVFVWTMKECPGATIRDRTVSVTASGTKVEDYDPLSPILDNFNDNGLLNRWGGATGTFAPFMPPSTGGPVRPPPACIKENSQQSPYEGSWCLKLSWAVMLTGDYAGYYTKLQSKNLTGYKSLSFFVRGAAGGEFFKIELKNNSSDTARNHAAIYVTDYLDGGVKTYWQKVNIPFHNFVNLDGFTSMKELAFTFENSASTTNGSPKYGTVYIDKIYFEPADIVFVRVDHYGDKLGVCALGGNMGTASGSGGTCTYSFSPTNFYGFANGLDMNFNVTTGWAGVFNIFGGGNDGWTKIPHNFSEFNYLKIYIKAKSDTANPKVLKIELVDNYEIRPVGAIGITSTWQYWRIPLTTFQNLDKTTIKQINFIFDNSLINYYGGSKTGGVYVDKVNFEK